MKPPHISTERLILHGLSPCDAETIYSYRTRPEVYAHQTWVPGSISEVQDYIAKSTAAGMNVVDTWFQLGMYLRSDGKMVGDVGLHFLLPDNQQTEIGFTTAPEHQRKGFAFEAVAAVIGYLFKVMGKHRIIGSVDPMNAASIALLEKLGMRREGYFKRSIRIRNQWEDDIIYAILNEEWPERYRPR